MVIAALVALNTARYILAAIFFIVGVIEIIQAFVKPFGGEKKER